MKSAIFVEGHTEVHFVRELIKELAGASNVKITEEEFFSGTFFVRIQPSNNAARSEVLIVNCCNDGKVASAIRDRYAGLVNAGYQYILGVRDLYPLPLTDLEKTKSAIATILPKGAVPAHIVVAVMEVESWFLEEETHFENMSASLTQQNILSNTGYDIAAGASESIHHPAVLIDQIYRIAGLGYRKKQHQVERTLAAMDFVNLCVESRKRSASLEEFLSHVEAVLS